MNALATQLVSNALFQPAVAQLRSFYRHFKIPVAFLIVLSMTVTVACAKDIRWSSLNLTSQQESSMTRLEDHWQQTHSEVSAQIERDRQELRSLLPTGDTQRIRSVQNRMISNKMYLMNESMNTYLQKRDLLSPDQRAQLQKMLPNSVNLHALGGSN